MEIKTKCNIGDKVYFPWSDVPSIATDHDCPACNGTGKVTINGIKYRCPNSFCHEGKITSYELPPMYSKLSHIERITTDTNKENVTTISYYFYGGLWKEADLGKNWFTNLEDCKKHCNEINKDRHYEG